MPVSLVTRGDLLFSEGMYPVSAADCSNVAPTCKYQLNGRTTFLSGPLPCTSGRTWTFRAGPNPTADAQVACSVRGRRDLIPVFSTTKQACSTSASSLSVGVPAVASTCSATQISLGAYVGKRGLGLACPVTTTLQACCFWHVGHGKIVVMVRMCND